MSDRERETYSRIKKKLADYECDVPQSCWEGVERGLRKQRRLIRHKRMARWSAAAAAAAIVGILLLFYNDNSEMLETQYAAVNDKISAPAQVSPTESCSAMEPIEPASGTDTRYFSNKPSLLAESEGNDIVRTITGNISSKDSGITNTHPEICDSTTTAVKEEINKDILIAKNDAVTDTDIAETDTVDFNELLRLYKDSKPNIQIARYEKDKYSDPVYDNGISISLVAANALNANIRRDRDMSQNNMPLHEELKLYSNEEQLKFKHKMPVSAGITVEKRWKNNWGIESGIMYTLLRSTYSTESNTQQGEQELHYIGIPVNVTYRFAQVKVLGFYAAAGPKIDFNVSGKRTESVQNNYAKSNASESVRDKKPQLSLQLRLGMACTIVKHLELYVEPSLAYYIDNKGDIPALWKDKPLNFVLQFGLRTGF